MDPVYATRTAAFPNLTQEAAPELLGETPFTEENILSLLIVLGSSISLVGLVFAFITYSLFSDLRNLSGTTLMNLLASLFMTQLLYITGVDGVMDSKLCVALAFSLQYIRLSVLSWMLCMARHIYRQFRNNVTLRPAIENSVCHDFLKYCLFSWGLPGIFLAISMYIHYRNTAGKLWDAVGLMDHNCWFVDTNAYIYGLLIPAIILLLLSLSYLIRAAVVAHYVTSMQIDKQIRYEMRRKRTLQIVLFIKLTLILGIIVGLGALVKLHKTTATWIAYNIGQSIQGILAAMLVTCNCQVLKMYTRRMHSKSMPLITTVPADEEVKDTASDISKTTSLQMLSWNPVPNSV